MLDQREAVLRRVAVLDDRAWDAACPVPGGSQPTRTVREIVAHLLLADALAVRGGVLGRWKGGRRLEMPGAWDPQKLRAMAHLPPGALVTLLAQRGQRAAQVISGAPASLARLPVGGPHGRRPLEHVWAERVLHEWLHEHDLAAAGPDRPAATPAPAVAAVCTAAVLRTVAVAVLPHVPLDGGVVRLTVECPDGAGDVTWGMDFDRRQYGPRVTARGTAAVRLTAPALALIANGRGDRIPGSVDVTGDEQLAQPLLDVLASPVASASSLCRGVVAPG